MRVVGVRFVDGTEGETNVRPFRTIGAAVGLGVLTAGADAAGAEGCRGAFV